MSVPRIRDVASDRRRPSLAPRAHDSRLEGELSRARVKPIADDERRMRRRAAPVEHEREDAALPRPLEALAG